MRNMITKTPNYTQQQQYRSTFEKMSSGKKVNRAADGAAQLAIAEKIMEKYRGQDVGTHNMMSGQDMLNIADSALSGVTDYLQRMNELSIQAMNGTLSDSDRQSIQNEVEQMKQGIQGIADQTQYNGKKVLDGSDIKGTPIATDGDSSVSIKQSVNASLDALGLTDYNVASGNFDLSSITKALEKVNSSRTQMGAQTNRLQHGINYNNLASQNQKAAESRIMDTEYGQASTNLKKNQVLQTYSMQMQRNQMQHYSRMMQNFTL